MLIPSRIYADTALTRQLVYNVTSYEKTTHRQDFAHGTQGHVSTNGADTATVSGRMAITTSAVNESVQYDYPTTPGKQYTFYILANPGPSDSFYLRVQRLDPQALIYDHLMTAGQNEFTFTAQGTSTRLRPRRTDHTNQGTMTSYIDRIILKETRDTLYQDTIQMATGEGYKYGFNGMEQENDWNGLGNSYDFGARIYDARGGRWLSRDMYESNFAFEGGYNMCSNNPIIYKDPDGMKKILTITYINSKTGEYLGKVVLEVSDDVVPVKKGATDEYYYYEWHDINASQTISIDPNSGEIVGLGLEETTVGELRKDKDGNPITSWFNFSFVGDALVDDGALDEWPGSGIMWTSESGQNGESTGAKSFQIDDIDLLLTVLGATKTAAGVKKGKSVMDIVTYLNDAVGLADAYQSSGVTVQEIVKEFGKGGNNDKLGDPFDTVCRACKGRPHGLTDVVRDKEGNTIDTLLKFRTLNTA
jgi:RHS repeat-associated protein